MLLNTAKARVTVFTVSELLRKNQQGRGGGKVKITLQPRLGLKGGCNLISVKHDINCKTIKKFFVYDGDNKYVTVETETKNHELAKGFRQVLLKNFAII